MVARDTELEAGLIRRIWGWLVVAGAVLMMLTAAFFSGKRGGRSAQRFEGRKREIEKADAEELSNDLDELLR